jgi:hypothetical protein
MSLWKELFGGAGRRESQSDTELLAELIVTGYRTTLDRMRQLSDQSIRDFVTKYLVDASVAQAVCNAGLDKIALTTQDNKEHSIAWALRDGVMLGVQTIPASISSAADWFTAEFGGYSGYCSSVLNPVLETTGNKVMVHVVFGQDRVEGKGWKPWTVIAILPLRDRQFVSPLLPRTCCNAQERARYGL